MPAKRTLSPPSSSAVKRARMTAASSRLERTTPLTLDAHSLSDELFISILMYLSPYDLSAVERVDRHFLRLANDPILWRDLFQHAHPVQAANVSGRTAQRGILPADLSSHRSEVGHGVRTIARLPTRSIGVGQVERLPERNIDWKYLFRLETNWTFGRASLHPLRLSTSPGSPDAIPSPVPIARRLSSSYAPRPRARPTTLLALAAPLVVSASRSLVADTPTISLSLASTFSPFPSHEIGSQLMSFQSKALALERETGRVRGRVAVEELVVDAAGWQQASVAGAGDGPGFSSLRVYVSYSTGAFSIFLISLSSRLHPQTATSLPPTATEVYFRPSPTAPPLHPTILSALHGSLLVRCSDHFILSFYTLPLAPASSPSTPLRPFRTLKSHTSWSPAALILVPQPAESSGRPAGIKCSLAHAVPVYPDSWTVAVQEIDLVPTATSWRLESTQTRSALSALSTPDATQEWGGVGIVRGRVTAVGMSEGWVCVGTADNEVMAWQIPADSSSGRLRLGRSMMGAHWGEVGAVAIFGDRCVTADSLGRILIWSLQSLFRDDPPLEPPSTLPPRPRSVSPPASLGTPPTRSPTIPSSALPSPPPTPHPALRPQPSFVEVLPPPKPDGDERGEERMLWVGLDGERILSLSTARGGGGAGDGVRGLDDGQKGRAKLWAFDC